MIRGFSRHNSAVRFTGLLAVANPVASRGFEEVAVKLRLMRIGKKKQPAYRVVAADARSPRNGRFIEIVGTYDPRAEPSAINIKNDRAVHWLSVGAQPTERVKKLLTISGAWGEFSGDAAPEAYVAPSKKKSKKQLEREADAAAEAEAAAEAKAEEAAAAAAAPEETAAEEAAAEEAPAEEAAAEEAAVEEAPAEEAAAEAPAADDAESEA